MNATLLEPTGSGYLSIYPFNPSDPAALPTTSNLNYAAGQTVPRLAFASPGSVANPKTGSYDLSLYLGGEGNAQLVLDELGCFANEQ